MKILYTSQQAIDDTLKEISNTYQEYKKFCDLGCGRGERTLFFNEFGRDVTGVDYIDYQMPSYGQFNFINGNLLNNNFSAGSFDMILCFDVIEHLEEPEKLLTEIYRLLRKGGICVLSTPNRYRLGNFPLVLLGIRKYPYCLDAKNHSADYPEYWHLREYTTAELKSLAKKLNFKVKKVYKAFYGLVGFLGFKSFLNLPFGQNLILIIEK